MKRLRTAAMTALLLGFTLGHATPAVAQSTEERFQDIFITAGYTTAFGAALGAACLSFFDNPQDNLQYVAIGASLGFIGGSVLGTYMVLSPVVAEGPLNGSTITASQVPAEKLLIRPVFDRKSGNISQIETAFTLMSW